MYTRQGYLFLQEKSEFKIFTMITIYDVIQQKPLEQLDGSNISVSIRRKTEDLL